MEKTVRQWKYNTDDSKLELQGFYVVVESFAKITKVNHLIRLLHGKIIDEISLYTKFPYQHISNTSSYCYISDKQYNDILEELTNEGLFDASTSIETIWRIAQNNSRDSKLAHSVFFSKHNGVVLSDMKYYNDYLYITNEILSTIFNQSNRLSRNEMGELNKIYRNLNV